MKCVNVPWWLERGLGYFDNDEYGDRVQRWMGAPCATTSLVEDGRVGV